MKATHCLVHNDGKQIYALAAIPKPCPARSSRADKLAARLRQSSQHARFDAGSDKSTGRKIGRFRSIDRRADTFGTFDIPKCFNGKRTKEGSCSPFKKMSSIARNASAHVPSDFCADWRLPSPLAGQSDRCQAPDQQQNRAHALDNGNSGPTNRSDTSKLSDCNGVLMPPSIGDGDLVKPAPPIGNTPIIPPDFPKQQ